MSFPVIWGGISYPLSAVVPVEKFLPPALVRIGSYPLQVSTYRGDLPAFRHQAYACNCGILAPLFDAAFGAALHLPRHLGSGAWNSEPAALGLDTVEGTHAVMAVADVPANGTESCQR